MNEFAATEGFDNGVSDFYASDIKWSKSSQLPASSCFALVRNDIGIGEFMYSYLDHCKKELFLFCSGRLNSRDRMVRR